MLDGVLTGEPVAVIKIGGSILTDARAYRRAAEFVRNRHRVSPTERLVVVVSAQKGSTDDLEAAARKIIEAPDPAALDILWSTGELRSVALLTLHLQALGVPAVAVNIHEAGLTVPENERDAITGHVQIQSPAIARIPARPFHCHRTGIFCNRCGRPSCVARARRFRFDSCVAGDWS